MSSKLDDTRIGQNIIAMRRITHNMTQVALATKAGVDRRQLQQLNRPTATAGA